MPASNIRFIRRHAFRGQPRRIIDPAQGLAVTAG
jgi:hypothetical protein